MDSWPHSKGVIAPHWRSFFVIRISKCRNLTAVGLECFFPPNHPNEITPTSKRLLFSVGWDFQEMDVCKIKKRLPESMRHSSLTFWHQKAIRPCQHPTSNIRLQIQDLPKKASSIWARPWCYTKPTHLSSPMSQGLRSKHRWHRPSEEEGRDTARKGWQVRPLGFFGCAEICWLHFVWNLQIQSWECWGLHKSSSMSSFPRKRAGQLRASGHFTHHRITPRLPELPEAPRLPHDGH